MLHKKSSKESVSNCTDVTDLQAVKTLDMPTNLFLVSCALPSSTYRSGRLVAPGPGADIYVTGRVHGVLGHQVCRSNPLGKGEHYHGPPYAEHLMP